MEKAQPKLCPVRLLLVIGIVRAVVLRRSVFGIAALGRVAALAVASLIGRIAAGAVVVCIRCVRRIICVVRTHD